MTPRQPTGRCRAIRPRVVAAGALVAGLILWVLWPDASWAAPAQGDPLTAIDDVRTFFGLSPRNVVWIVAQLHLLFAAFVLGVPIFAVIVEFI